ncbi:MAG: hypothetical protein ACJAZ7_002035 [Zhongshania aliphaticivorans]|jgi:hypothetical protein
MPSLLGALQKLSAARASAWLLCEKRSYAGKTASLLVFTKTFSEGGGLHAAAETMATASSSLCVVPFNLRVLSVGNFITVP